ncbi:MAG: hypothetical protein IKO21_05965 [Fibrobacter sp.]|nr:hypothetical protein [Fibrobacter sp.]
MRQTCALAYDDNLTVVASSSWWSVADHLLLPLHQPRLWREVAKKLADDLQKATKRRRLLLSSLRSAEHSTSIGSCMR